MAADVITGAGIVVILVAWISKLHHGVRATQAKLSEMRENQAIDYAPRPEVERRFAEAREHTNARTDSLEKQNSERYDAIQKSLDKIFDKLDGKADK